ncbi:hypothetical protein PAMP_001508 [Pampus punctatissimus]
MAEEYCQYKNLKAKLRLLEALLNEETTVQVSECVYPPRFFFLHSSLGMTVS